MRFPIFLSKRKLKMRDSLFGYMMILTSVILIVIIFGMVVLGTFNKPSDDFSNTLELQMKVFERDILSHHEEMAVRSTSISKDTSVVIRTYLEKNGLSFGDIKNSDTHIANIQKELFELLCDEIFKTESSGVFVLLDTTVNESSGGGFSRSGIYVQRGSQNLSDDTLLLYRGNPTIGKAAGVMPHRKWQLEFDTRIFPNYNELMSDSPDIPLEKAYRFSNVSTIPGTSEKAVLMTMPIRGINGEIYGICGFEISEHTFKLHHPQASTISRLMCVWTPKTTMLNADNSIVCGTDDGYFLPFYGSLKIGKDDDGLVTFNGDSGTYIGAMRIIDNGFSDKHMLCVIMPKEDYDKALSLNTVQIFAFLILLSSFAISLCRILSKKFLSPSMKGLEQIRLHEHSDSASNLSEMSDLFDFLAEKDKEYEIAYEELSEEKEKAEAELLRVQGEIEKLSYSRKNEINPDDYENFVIGIGMLTKSERNIFEMYLAGKTAKEIIEATGIKESTLKFHNSNIYEKLGVASRKQMLRYAALYTQENGGKI